MIKDYPVTIIAEAGVNHNGKVELAKKLIDQAANAGADFVKFQAFSADRLVSKKARKADYQIANTVDGDKRQYDMLKKLEIDQASHQILMDYASEKGIGFLSSPFDEDGIDMLCALGLSIFKVPSGEITNLPYLKKLGELKATVIMSTGMATLKEVEKAIDILEQAGTERSSIIVLHCNTDYPTRYQDVNLRAMLSMKESLNVEVGYSDHTIGIEVPIAATALGATVIEKHFTLSRDMDGPDHKASLEPPELKAMVNSIRHIEKALGSGVKEPSPLEQKNRAIVRKSIHIVRHVSKGCPLQEADLIMLRPGDGISPMNLDHVLGKETKYDLEKGRKLKFSDLVSS